jgi:hypothetical protein
VGDNIRKAGSRFYDIREAESEVLIDNVVRVLI